jgi:hypothetical protein
VTKESFNSFKQVNSSNIIQLCEAGDNFKLKKNKKRLPFLHSRELPS